MSGPAWRLCSEFFIGSVQVRPPTVLKQLPGSLPIPAMVQTLASTMASTMTATAPRHGRVALVPDWDSGPSFADVVYLLTNPPPDADPKKAWSLSSRIPRYAALFAYSLVHPSGFALWVNDTLGISDKIRDATYPEVQREWVEAAKAKIGYVLSVVRPFLFASRGPEARAREAAVRLMPVHGPVKDG